jgi:hypothetical protein
LGGNPAYLESVSIVINKLFGGKVAEFCKYEELFLTEDIKLLLNHQFSRLSVSEKEVIKYLANEVMPVNTSKIIELLDLFPANICNAILSLVRRGLINQTIIHENTSFSLQLIVKYFTAHVE